MTSWLAVTSFPLVLIYSLNFVLLLIATAYSFQNVWKLYQMLRSVLECHVGTDLSSTLELPFPFLTLKTSFALRAHLSVTRPARAKIAAVRFAQQAEVQTKAPSFNKSTFQTHRVT
jgi:hypothetical protein